MTDTGACGTYAGALRHRRRGEPLCNECRLAAADYVRHYRQTHPAAVIRHREVTRARWRALTRLSHNHPEEYRTLYAHELATARGTFEPSCPCWEPGDGGQCSTCGEVQA